MFLKPYTLKILDKNIIVLPESVIYEEVERITEEEISTYISKLFEKYPDDINTATYYQVILWASDGHLNADIWTFYLKTWDYNTDINVINFIDLEIDETTTIITNKDGLLILAEIEKTRLKFFNINDFIATFDKKLSSKETIYTLPNRHADIID